MNWFSKYLSSSIGRKQLMAATGLFFCVFLKVHLLGNLILFQGYDLETGACAFNDYAATLTGNKGLLYTAEAVMIVFFLTHVYLAIRVTLENNEARGPVSYQVNANSGSLGIASTTMPISGALIFIFIVIHLINFKFAEQGPLGLYGVVQSFFQSPVNVIYYILTFVVLAAHVGHGLRSALQTLGLNHKKYNGLIRNISWIYAAFIFIGYSSIPLWFFFCKGNA